MSYLRDGGGPSRPAPKPKRAPKRKVKRPSVSSRTHAAEQQYKSQGRSIEKQANQQRKARVQRQHEAKDTKGDADRGRAQKHVDSQYKDKRAKRLIEKKVGHPVAAPPDIAGKEYQRKKGEARAAEISTSPVLRVLEQTIRPVQAVAGGTRAAIHGKNVLKAAGRGAANKDKTLFGDVLKDLGAPKIVQAVGGTALDVGLDPTTYATGGTGAVIKKSVIKSAEKQAVKQGAKTAAAATARTVTKKEANRAETRAAGGGPSAPSLTDRAKDRALKNSKEKGVTVKFAGKEVPGVRKGTAVASRPVKAVGRRAPGRQKARHVGADINPNIAPVGVDKASHKGAVQVTRTARAKTSHGQHEAQQIAVGIRTKIGEANYAAVVDAIEARSIHTLPPELQAAARHLRSHFRHTRRLERRAGQNVAKNRDYVPRHLSPEALVELTAKEAVGLGKKRKAKSGYLKRRQYRQPMAELRVTQPGKFDEDLAAVTAKRTAEGRRDVAFAEMNRDLGNLGRAVSRPVRVGPGHHPAHVLDIREGEGVFHIRGGMEPRLVTDSDELRRIARPIVMNKKGSKLKNTQPASVKGGRYVVLNKEMVKRAVEGRSPAMQGPGIIKAFDKGTAGFKLLAIGTPGFHVRNFVGDMNSAYLGQGGHKLGGNLTRAGRVLKAYHRQEKAMRNLTPVQVGKATTKTKLYGDVTYDEIAKQLRDNGAFRSGYIARELPELSQGGVKVPGGKVVPGSVKNAARGAKEQAARAMMGREDLPRLTTAMEALRQGATYKEAAQSVANLHFDYQHLTNFERQIMRRAMPFYTWSARNIPLQSKMVIARPGKYAQFEKVREEATANSGAQEKADEAIQLYTQLEKMGVDLPEGWEKGISKWEQRNASIPINWKGGVFTVSAGLPLQDLNEFPGAAMSNQLNEYFEKGMSLVNPLPKDIVEYFGNHSFFFRDQLERDDSPLVPAPAWASKLPDYFKKAAWVHERTDKKTGKKVLMWRGKADYLVKTVPGTPLYIQQLMTNSDRRGRTAGAKLLGWAGMRSSPYDPVTNAINIAFAERAEARKERAAYEATDPEYADLSEKIKGFDSIIYGGKSQRGDAVLPKAGKPKINKPRSSPGVSAPNSNGVPSFSGHGGGGSGVPSFSGHGSSSGSGVPKLG